MEKLERLKAMRDKICGDIVINMEQKKGDAKRNRLKKKAWIHKVRYIQEEECFLLSGDILSPELEEYDESFFRLQERDEQCIVLKPIFWGFKVRIKQKDIEHFCGVFDNIRSLLGSGAGEFVNFLQAASDLFESSPAGMLGAFMCKILYFSPDSPIRESSDRQYDEWDYRITSACEQELSKWLFEFVFTNRTGYEADVFFAASPFRQCQKYIAFKKGIPCKNDPPIPHSIISLDSSIISSLSLSKFVPSALTVYKVGQGNFSTIQNKKKDMTVVYDVGFTTKETHSNYTGAQTALQTLDASCYIISHLDLDHIIGTIYLDDTQFTSHKNWIIPVPKQADISLSARRLIHYLHLNSNLFQVEIADPNGFIPINKKMTIYQGTGKDKNGNGVILAVSGKKTALLTGDCLYQYFGSQVPIKCDYLCVPHHGCVVPCVTVEAKVSKQSKAIIPVGDNDYGHPNIDHIDLLEDSHHGFVVEQTQLYPSAFRIYNL